MRGKNCYCWVEWIRKTTLVKLLCRFYIPDEGQILLNGRNIYEYNEEEYNSFISAVFQDYKLFSFSLKDNILLGKTENPEDINIALKKVDSLKD